MGNNRAFEAYSIGYDPDAVEHDLQIISQLTRGMTGSKKKADNAAGTGNIL